MTQFDRITQDAGVMGGKACIRAMRVTVGMIVGQVGAGVPLKKSSPTTPIWSAETSCRLFATPRH